ncbi:MAG TPA: hypothetical protein VK509_20335 [Polyangiales bacterium]|nr:hypothetical protein [Polyangiales bacterium]
MRTLVFILSTLILSIALCACGARSNMAPDGIEVLRRRAAAAPSDPALQRELALAELFDAKGEPKNAGPQLERALTLAPHDAQLLLVRGVYLDVHGAPGRALDDYLAALDTAAKSQHPLAPQTQELAMIGIGGLDGAVVGYAGKVRAALEALGAGENSRLAIPARFLVGSALIDFAYRRGERDGGQAIAAQLGCVTSWRAAGPFGPRELLGFDAQHAVRPGQPLLDSYDLGPGRGVRPSRELGAHGCAVNLGGSPVAEGGTTYARTELAVATQRSFVLRLQTSSNVELFVDGKSITKLDTRRALLADVNFVQLELAAGKHEMLLKLTTRHPNPAMSLALIPSAEVDFTKVGLPGSDESQGFERYMRAAIALARGDVLAARASLSDVAADKPAAPLRRLQRASLLLSDPLLPSDKREDESRRQLLAAQKRDPELWGPPLQLASMMAGNGRAIEAIAALRKAYARWPEVPGVGLALAGMLREQQWTAEADVVIDQVYRRVPDACGVLSAKLEALRDRQREEQAAELVDKLMTCEAQSNARYALLLRQRRWADAQNELQRLESLEPPQARYAWLLARLELAKNRGDDAAIDQTIADLTARYPRSSTGAVEAVDRLAGRGDQAGALALARATLEREPASMAELYRLVPVLGGQHLLASFRKDGPAQIARFEASGRKYDGPQVLVFDYMAVRVLPDMSSVSLVHSIEKAQSDEAVEDLAEVQLPEGAQVLTLRLIKADGRRLEPDQIEGKDTVSLPSVARGDYVESEYLLYHSPPEGFPNGYTGDRFYFKSFEIPFDHSEIAIILPKDLQAEVDPRGDAPKREERIEGDLRIWRFAVDDSTALKTEPGAVSVREYLPSIRVGAAATYPKLIESIREALIDRDIYDPDLAELALKIAGKSKDPRERAQRLYDWVLINVEESEDLFSQAAVMLRARSGNRARVLHYLYGLAGVPSQLVLARNSGADNTPSTMADGDTYSHLLVTVGAGKDETWLFTSERHASFGYLPAQLRGQPALRLNAAAEPARTPAIRPGDELRRLVFEIALAPNGSAKVKATETVVGTGAVSWRSNLESIPAAELEHRFEEEYVARLMPGARLTDLDINVEGRGLGERAVVLKYGFELSSLGRRIGERWALPSMLEAELSNNYAQLAQRTTIEQIASPLELDVVVHIQLPKGSARPALPPPVRLQAAIDGRPSFSMNSRIENEQIVVERSLRVPPMRVRPEQYPAFASFCRAVDAAEAKELLVRLP